QKNVCRFFRHRKSTTRTQRQCGECGCGGGYSRTVTVVVSVVYDFAAEPAIRGKRGRYGYQFRNERCGRRRCTADELHANTAGVFARRKYGSCRTDTCRRKRSNAG